MNIRKWLITVVSILYTVVVSAQSTFPNQNINNSTAQTMFGYVGGIGSNSGFQFIRKFNDTAQLNTQLYLKNTPRLMIAAGDSIYMRNNAATKWILINGAVTGGIAGIDSIRLNFDSSRYVMWLNGNQIDSVYTLVKEIVNDDGYIVISEDGENKVHVNLNYELLNFGDTTSDKLIKYGGTQIEDTVVTILAPIIWRMGGYVHTEPNNQVFNINKAADGNFRTDLIYIASDSLVHLLPGVEAPIVTGAPDVPAGGIFITTINVAGGVLNHPIPHLYIDSIYNNPSVPYQLWIRYNNGNTSSIDFGTGLVSKLDSLHKYEDSLYSFANGDSSFVGLMSGSSSSGSGIAYITYPAGDSLVCFHYFDGHDSCIVWRGTTNNIDSGAFRTITQLNDTTILFCKANGICDTIITTSTQGGLADSVYFWNRKGNAISDTSFIGTKNNRSFRFRTNNIERGYFDSTGVFVIRSPYPAGAGSTYMSFGQSSGSTSYFSGGASVGSDWNSGYNLVIGNSGNKILDINTSSVSVKPQLTLQAGFTAHSGSLQTFSSSPLTGFRFDGSNIWNFAISNSPSTNALIVTSQGRTILGRNVLVSDSITASVFTVKSTSLASIPFPIMTTSQRNAVVSGIVSGSTSGGTGYTNGTYSNISLTGGTGTGATANITVTGGVVTVSKITNPGSGYTVGDVLSASIPAGSGFTLTISTLTGTAGLTVYCSDCTATDASTGVTQTYNGTTWKNYW